MGDRQTKNPETERFPDATDDRRLGVTSDPDKTGGTTETVDPRVPVNQGPADDAVSESGPLNKVHPAVADKKANQSDAQALAGVKPSNPKPPASAAYDAAVEHAFNNGTVIDGANGGQTPRPADGSGGR